MNGNQVNPATGSVPSLLSAVLKGVGGNQVVAVSVNGKIAATTRTFRYDGEMRFGAMIPPSSYRRKNNSVAIFRVGGGDHLTLISQHG